MQIQRMKRGIYRARCNATPQERIDARIYMTTNIAAAAAAATHHPPPEPVLLEKQLLR